MRCNGSPTTSSADSGAAARDAALRTVSAVLFREILRPLAAGLGPLGDVALEPLADRLARVRPS
jgi:hypothetical protein